MTDTYEFQERVAIIMEACNYSESEAIGAAMRQQREEESRERIKAAAEGFVQNGR